MILLFSDFGATDFYAGQVGAAIRAHAADVDIVDLLHEAPRFDIKASAHLLAGLALQFEVGFVCLAVVDPGVGSDRGAVVVMADGRWYVGPDNGLLSVVAARAERVELWEITWRPEGLSRSFHGRDLFAPVAAWIASGAFPRGKLAGLGELTQQLDATDLAEIIYIDHFGNAITGLRGESVSYEDEFRVANREVAFAPVFCAAPAGRPFWYINSINLVELAVNRGSAAQLLGLRVGDRIDVVA